MIRIGTVFTLVLLGAACGPSPRHSNPPRPLAASEHEQQARIESAEAARDEAQISPDTQVPSDEVSCMNSGIPLTSGGARIDVMKPCWTNQESNKGHREAAAYHRAQARKHRKEAAHLRAAEHRACAGLGEDDKYQDSCVMPGGFHGSIR